MHETERQYLPGALHGHKIGLLEAFDLGPDDPEEDPRDTLPSPSPLPDEEESPESDGRPIERPHLESARRLVSD